MSAEPTFRCPVCRASQPLRETCRRCQADLSLVVRAHRRLTHLKGLQAETLASGDGERAQEIKTELRWLAPSVDRLTDAERER
jgi:hypothetical protein